MKGGGYGSCGLEGSSGLDRIWMIDRPILLCLIDTKSSKVRLLRVDLVRGWRSFVG